MHGQERIKKEKKQNFNVKITSRIKGRFVPNLCNKLFQRTKRREFWIVRAIELLRVMRDVQVTSRS